MTREDMIGLAIQAGLLESGYLHSDTVLSELERFVNAILDLVEDAFLQPCVGDSIEEIQEVIRVLKINTGD